MTPREIAEKWVELFNARDVRGIVGLYHEDGVDHQLPEGPAEGRARIEEVFEQAFAEQDMHCIIESIHELGDMIVVEWFDKVGFHGCSFFTIEDGKIILHRGFWDKLTARKLRGQPPLEE